MAVDSAGVRPQSEPENAGAVNATVVLATPAGEMEYRALVMLTASRMLHRTSVTSWEFPGKLVVQRMSLSEGPVIPPAGKVISSTGRGL